MLRESEIRVLQTVDTELSVSEIADRLGKSSSYISEVVTDLEDKQLVNTQRGRTKQVSPIDSKAIEILHSLKHTHPHIDFPDLISGKAIPVIYYLDEERTVAELAEKTGDYRNTVNRVVTRLRDRGILRKNDSAYRLNDGFELLHRFAQEYVHHRHRITASQTVSSFTILWESLDEFLLQTTEKIDSDGFLETGPSRFQDFDLPLVTTNQRYYFYTETRSEISASELVCHTLLIDDDTRYQTYCLLLIQKQSLSRQDLVSTAEKYSVEETVKNLFEYLETQGKERTPSLPDWSEFNSLADDYEVTI